MKFTKLLVAIPVIAFALTYSSCQNDEKITQEDEMAEGLNEEPSEAEKDFIASLDINLNDAVLQDFIYPDGTTEPQYIVEGDIAMTVEEFEKLQASPEELEATLRQYRSYNLCDSPQTISVIGYTGGGGYGLTNKMQTALGWAINNYNNINTGLNFTLTYGTNYSSYDMVVYRVPNGEVGGVAGFPYSNGNPYKWVQIFSGMDNYNTNTNEHVITHEIGHCVGLRHTDWWNRASCGSGGGEGANPSGAVHVPGTPTNIDWNSVMLACFGSNEDGEFGFYDEVALEYLY